MRAIVLGRAATVLSWGVLTAVLYGADCLAAETGKRIGREEMIVEPGDPEARYDRNRRDWFVRPKTLAKPEDGTPASQMEISLLDSSPVLPVNGPGIEALGPWASPAMDSIEKVLDSAGLDQPVIMVITLRPKAKPEFAVVASEKLGAEARQKIVQMLEQPAPPRPFFVDCHFAFVYHPRKMKASNDPGIPASLYPSWQESRQYQGAATAEKVRLLRKWCREQVVPLLAGAATQADSQFEGVRAFGDRILHLDPNQPFDVEKLTFHDPNFWRATLEMARGNSTIAGCQIALFAANGELAKASQHPIGLTGHGGENNDEMLASPADWFSPGADPWPDLRKDPRAVDGKKVSLLDTDHVFGVGGDQKWVWKGFLRGHNVIFMDPYGDPQWEPILEGQGVGVSDAEKARLAMGHARRYAERMDLAKATPRPELASTGYCLADPGSEYLVYLPEGGKATVDLSAAKSKLAVEWSHPITGKITPADPIDAGAKREFAAPFEGDAVLYLRVTQ
ncbi:MAG: putative collagen-binding domain-containing protein [Phycisphaerales bacterium]